MHAKVRLPILSIACLVLVILAGAQSGAAQSDTVHVNPGEHAAVEIDFREGPTKDVTYDVVQEGPNIDVLFMDNANYQKYQEGEAFEYQAERSDLDTGDTEATFRLERHATWWLVIDHSDRPEDGTAPATVGAESVTARYTVDAQTNVTDEARDRADRLPGPGPAVAAGLISTVALAASRMGR
jgi:hypothetical protein